MLLTVISIRLTIWMDIKYNKNIAKNSDYFIRSHGFFLFKYTSRKALNIIKPYLNVFVREYVII